MVRGAAETTRAARGPCVSSAPLRSRERCARACRTRSKSWCRRGSCARCDPTCCSYNRSGWSCRALPRGSSARCAQSCCSCSTTARRGSARTRALCAPCRYICNIQLYMSHQTSFIENMLQNCKHDFALAIEVTINLSHQIQMY